MTSPILVPACCCTALALSLCFVLAVVLKHTLMQLRRADREDALELFSHRLGH